MSNHKPPPVSPGQYVLRSIFGAWRYALFDKSALTWFDLSAAGFWRSFWAAVIVAPLYLLTIATVEPDASAEGTAGFGVGAGLVMYGAMWIVFPLLMVPIARFLDLSRNYVSFIIVHNWSQVVILLALLPVNLAGLSGGVEAGAVNLAGLVVRIAILAYSWFIARETLGITAMTAVGIVLLDEISTLLIIVLGSLMAAA